jgi:tRNA nucleotidyltransferase (CCA-adding enzyme)
VSNLSNAVQSLREMFPPELHHRLLLVGGSVRDSLSGLPIRDIDLITDIQEKTLLRHHFRRVQGKTTAPIYFKSDPVFGKIEITLLQDNQSLEDDLKRRDFRCNAVAMSLDGSIIDPLNGSTDIKNRILSMCGAASLRDDPIRIFRAFRFAAEGWEIGPELAETINSGKWEENLTEIPVERFSHEMLKALAGVFPWIFFACMLKYGVGRCYLPELFRMQEIPAGPTAYHGTDTVFSHSLHSLQRMSAMSTDIVARMSAFFHDLGKLSTAPEFLPRHIGHDMAGAEMARQLAVRLRLTARQRNALAASSKLHMKGGRWSELRDVTRLKLAEEACKSGIADFFPQLVAADRAIAAELPGWNEMLRAASFSSAELGIDTATLESMSDRSRSLLITQMRLKQFRQLYSNIGNTITKIP